MRKLIVRSTIKYDRLCDHVIACVEIVTQCYCECCMSQDSTRCHPDHCAHAGPDGYCDTYKENYRDTYPTPTPWVDATEVFTSLAEARAWTALQRAEARAAIRERSAKARAWNAAVRAQVRS